MRRLADLEFEDFSCHVTYVWRRILQSLYAGSFHIRSIRVHEFQCIHDAHTEAVVASLERIKERRDSRSTCILQEHFGVISNKSVLGRKSLNPRGNATQDRTAFGLALPR